jgi:hypothetical protein
MNENRNMKRAGWLAATAALILAGALSISGASRPDPKPRPTGTVSAPAATDGFLTAQADSDVLDLQLD